MIATQNRIQSPEEIAYLFNTKSIDTGWSFAEYKPSDTGKWTHDYHRYPAKFIPQLVEKLMDEYITSREAHVNDPFYGLSKIKSLESTQATLFPTLFQRKDIEPLIPERHVERINYWFTEENKIELGKILRSIYEEEDETIRAFLLVAFSHILKNCSIWLQKSTKPTRDLSKKPAEPYKTLKRHLRKMQKGNNDFYGVVPQNVRENISDYLNIKIGDAKRQPVPDNSVDLIITSSPYVTSYEYADLHQLSTIWLDLVDDLTEYKKEFIGTSYKRYKDKKLRSKIAMDIVNKMAQKSRKVAKEIEAFFIDMEEVFDESYRILKPGGRCCYVIGNTKLKGVEILNAEIFAESLQYSGFELDRIIKREIPSKILPQKRDEKTGRFARNDNANTEAYPLEYIVIGLKE